LSFVAATATAATANAALWQEIEIKSIQSNSKVAKTKTQT